MYLRGENGQESQDHNNNETAAAAQLKPKLGGTGEAAENSRASQTPGSESLKSDSIPRLYAVSGLSNGKFMRTFKSAFVFLNMFELTGGNDLQNSPTQTKRG